MVVPKDVRSLPLATSADTSSTDSAVTASKAVWSVPAIVAQAFSVTSHALRVRVLSRLLASVGPLALVVLGGGAFVKFVQQARWSGLTVSVEDAARVTSGQVFDLVSYVQQSNPEVAEQVLAFLSQDHSTMAALGASVAAIVIGYLSARTSRPEKHS